jgi:hypothetical protein
MDTLASVIKHLKHNIPSDFFGKLVVHIKSGIPVHLTEERSIKLEDEKPIPKKKDE